jgi:hypothetical protein
MLSLAPMIRRARSKFECPRGRRGSRAKLPRRGVYSICIRKLLYELYPSNPQSTGAIVRGVGSVSYGTAKLSDVDDTYYYAVGCRSCLRHVRVSLVKLRARLGDDYRVTEVVKHLRCRTCRSKEVTVTFLAPHQSVGNLWHLFQQRAV